MAKLLKYQGGGVGFKKHRLSSRVMEDLKQRSFFGIVFYPVVLLLVLIPGDYYHRHPDFSNQLIMLVMGICLFRLIHWQVSRWLAPRFVRLNNQLFFLSVALTALIWGVGFAKFMLQDGEFNANLLMVICTVGLAAGAAVAFLPDFRLAFVFSFCMLMPAIIMMGINGINTPLLIALVLMFLYLCFMAYRGNQEYWTALENEYLLEEKSKDLEKISRVDGLTGLYNRRYFDEVLMFEWNRSLRKKVPLSIVLADLDYFKKTNDQHGHLAGDEYLKASARMLKNVFKRKTDIVARYGGEEFIVLMPDESGENAVELADKIRSKLERYQLEYDGQVVQTTLSLGVAGCIPAEGQDPNYLISRADTALYQSKADGRNRVTFSS